VFAHLCKCTVVENQAGEKALSGEERELLSLVVAGLRDREIAERLSLPIAEVKTAVAKLIEKLGVSNRLGLVIALVVRSP